MNSESKKGVSVILCCHNSSLRIRQTLEALASQEFHSSLAWEIILVDNLSTDQTAAVAKSTWEQLQAITQLRIVQEMKPGLAHARKKGITKASYSYLLFCDDDNWLDKNYVQKSFDILSNYSNVAACGGMGIPVFETTKPDWFDEYAEAFAIGSQEITSENGKILNLYGAGLCIKKEMLEKLEKTKFAPVMKGRTGKQLSSSEDIELTYALVLMGYELYYTPELKFFHYLPKERLTLAYLKKLFTAFGNDGPVRNLYYAMVSKRIIHKRVRNWNFHLLLSLVRLVKYSIRPPKKNGWSIYFNWNIAYIKELLNLRPTYAYLKENIQRIQKGSVQVQDSH